MSTQLRFTHLLSASALALALSSSAQAAVSRTFVSTIGNDANSSLNCSATAPCRTFTAALSVTSAGGEIVVLNSGGYGPATIGQPVTITAIGVDASISAATSGVNGLTIDTSGNVTLIGLNLHGEATGHDGIFVQEAGSLRLYNMLIENFTNMGVEWGPSGNLEIYDSAFNDNGEFGVILEGTSSSLYVENSSFEDNQIGIEIIDSHATVSGSSFLLNTSGILLGTGTFTLINGIVADNVTGLEITGEGVMYFADSLVTNNTTAYTLSSGCVLSGTSPGTNFITPGQATSGSISTVALQ